MSSDQRWGEINIQRHLSINGLCHWRKMYYTKNRATNIQSDVAELRVE